MSRGGRRLKWSADPTTTSNLDGIWNLNEINNLVTQTKWPRGPTAPTSLSATAGNSQLSLSWTAPTTTHGTITNYLVEYTPSGGSASYVLTNSTSTSYTLTGLTNGTEYTVRVLAVNFTAGDWSGTASGTPLSVVFNSIQSGWTGLGSSGDKLTPPQTGNASGWPGAFTNASFVAGTSGTLNVTPVTNDAIDDHNCRVKKNGSTVQNWGGLNAPAAVQTTVVNGDVILLEGDYQLLWNKGTRVWIE